MGIIWKRADRRFLLVAICSAILLTGCGGSAESAGDMSTGVAEVTSAVPDDSAVGDMSTEVAEVTSATPDDSAVGQDVKESARPDYVMVVQLTINPKMNLYLDVDGGVVDVEYLNEDAQNAFSDIDVTGISLKDAVSMIVDVSADKGYLSEGKTISVDIMEPSFGETLQESLSGEISQKLEEEVQAAVWETLAERQFTVTLEINGENVEETVNTGETGNAGDPVDPVDPQTTGTPETSQTVGEACPACGGTGICSECGGGTLPCKRCGGSLWESCGLCNGTGTQNCHGCRGTGTDSTDGSTCRYCGGAGKITCELCGGVGGKSCSICNGKGVVSDDCILCHGGKKCTTCGGTGIK